jgi:hypothetical protein
VRFNGRTRRTSKAGRATICARLRATGRRSASAKRAGYRSARASVRVVRGTRFTG